jgi:hypothetical protein
MTATHETLARPASLGNAATAIFALLGLIDVALTAVVVTRVISAVLAVPCQLSTQVPPLRQVI